MSKQHRHQGASDHIWTIIILASCFLCICWVLHRITQPATTSLICVLINCENECLLFRLPISCQALHRNKLRLPKATRDLFVHAHTWSRIQFQQSNIFEDRNIGFCIFSQKSFVSWEASLAPTHVRPLLTLSVSLDYGMSNIFWKIWPKAFHLAKKSTGPLPFNWPQILKMSNWQNHQIRPWMGCYIFSESYDQELPTF